MTAASINGAAPNASNDKDPSLIVKAEAPLDRAHFSPGAIDGFDGDNFHNAVRAFQEINGLTVTGNLDPDTWKALAPNGAAPVLKAYTISEADVAGPFTKAIPTNLEAMARPPGLSYTSPLAELAEKFHMAQSLLQRLNPLADFKRAEARYGSRRSGDEAPPRTPFGRSGSPTSAGGPIATRIVVDKPARNVRAYDQDGRLLAFYAATIGSEEKPAPSGVFKVNGVYWNPEYHYDPKFAWKGVETKRKLTVAPGPNNPVGLVWIDLTAPSYGITARPRRRTSGTANRTAASA